MLKKILGFVLIVSLVLPQTAITFADEQKDADIDNQLVIEKLAINPDYQRYLDNPDDERSGYVPTKYLFPTSNESARNTGEQLPAKFDARTKGWIPPIRDQKRTGTCWAHAIMACAETAFKKKGDLTSAEGGFYDFSEGHLAYNTGDKDTDLNTGGYVIFGGMYFSKLNGPVTEEDYPQYSISNAKGDTGNTTFEGVVFNERADKKDGSKYVGDMIVVNKSEIKKFVYEYGILTAVYKDTAWNSEYWQEGYRGTLTQDQNGYHNPDDVGYAHAIAIVGWDDNKVITNRKGQTSAGGAFLVRNSWGSRVGDHGYYWMSYETFADGEANYFVYTNVGEKRDNVYQFNVMDFETVTGMSVYDSVSKPQFIANNYKRSTDKKEKITDVALFNMTVGPTDFEIWVTEDPDWASKFNSGSGEKEDRLDKIGKKIAKFRLTSTGYFSRGLNLVDSGEYPLSKDRFTLIAKITPSTGEEARFANTASTKGSEGASYILLKHMSHEEQFISLKQWQNKDIKLSLNAVTKYDSETTPPSVTIPDTSVLKNEFEQVKAKFTSTAEKPFENKMQEINKLDMSDIGNATDVAKLEELKKKYSDLKIGDDSSILSAAAETKIRLAEIAAKNEENKGVFEQHSLADKKQEAEGLAAAIVELKNTAIKLEQDVKLTNDDINKKILKLEEKIQQNKNDTGNTGSTPGTPAPGGSGSVTPTPGGSGSGGSGSVTPTPGGSGGTGSVPGGGGIISGGGGIVPPAADNKEKEKKEPENKKDDNKKPTASDNIKLVASKIFFDVKQGAWYEAAVNYTVENKIMAGTSQNYFSPETVLTRAMMVQMLYNASGKPKTDSISPFKDVSETAWYRDAVVWAKSKGLVKGVSEYEFKPDKDITREEMITMMYNYAKSLNKSLSDSKDAVMNFKDSTQISEYALNSMKWAVKNSIVSGTEQGDLNPKGSATRAQTAQVMKNFMEKIGKN